MATRTKTMNTAPRTTYTVATNAIPSCRCSWLSLSCLILATAWIPLANAVCGVEFSYPQPGLTFRYLDTINVTYTATFPNPTLFTWCGHPASAPQQKFKTSVSQYNGSILVLLDFSPSDPCWFELRPDTPGCSDNSPQFSLLPHRRARSASERTLGPDPSAAGALTPRRTGLNNRAESQESTGASDERLSTGVKTGIAIAVISLSLVLAAMASCFFFRRRKRLQEAALARQIIEHDSQGKKGHEKTPLAGGSTHTDVSKEPLRGQPVYGGGFVGSAAYDGNESRGSSAYLHSPQSPGSSAGGLFPQASYKPLERQYMTDREALEAARLHSAPSSSGVVSYGPNPVTPSITPRPSRRFQDEPISSYGESYYPPSTHSTSPRPQTLSPAESKQPLVVSYGPNKITPTPVIASIAPDESIMKGPPDLPSFPAMGFPSPPFPTNDSTNNPTHEPRSRSGSIQDTPHDLVRHHLSDEALSAVPPPLPPYASSADFYAMEKGAIRKLGEPSAQAELPPTKDGYYHFGDHGTEYELQGAAPEREQQLPHQPYRNQTAGLGRTREVDEQKFLLDDAEMSYMREQKRRIREQQQQQQQQAARQGQPESYEMQASWRTGRD